MRSPWAATTAVTTYRDTRENGETFIDTAKNIEAMNVDAMVVRHHTPGTPYLLAHNVDCSVVNAGDGPHEHPTQALLDLYTMREKLGRLDGLRVAIVGDVLHSRVARSLSFEEAMNLLSGVRLGVGTGLVPGVGELGFMQGGAFQITGQPAWISRSGYTGEDGFEIGLPEADARALLERLLADWVA